MHSADISLSTLHAPLATLSLEEQVARLQALLDASRQVHATIDASEVLTRTARILVRELEVETALFLSANSEQVLASFGSQVAPPYIGCSCLPLRGKDNTLLAELLLDTGRDSQLSLYEQDFVDGLLLQATVALENAIFHERDVRWARVQQDLDAARGIQRSLMPKAMPTIANYSIAARMTTCYEVGGDYMDTLSLADGAYLLIVADVAGKGLASALVATSFRAAFRSFATQQIPLVEILSSVSRQHWEEGAEARRRYVTAIVVRLDPVRQTIEVVNAGHNPAVFLDPIGTLRMIEASGTPLGLIPTASYRCEVYHFPIGSRLLLYTDGLTEVFCGEEEFGCERLTEAFLATSAFDAEETLDCLWRTLSGFSNESAQTDDMTALAVCHGIFSSPVCL